MKESQQKQRLLWKDLILRYCKHNRIHMVPAEDADDFPLFHNRAINREPPLARLAALCTCCACTPAAAASRRSSCSWR